MKSSVHRILFLPLLCVSIPGCRQNQNSVPPPRDDFAQRPRGNSPAGSNGTRLPNGGLPDGAQMKGVYNMKAPLFPDAQITPGDTLDVTAADIAVSGYSKKVRNVPSSVKKKAYLNYGIMSRQKGEYEVDHLISLQLGGSNSIRNLWPQSFHTQPWNAYIKDVLETKLHDEVVNGKMPLAQAQRMIASNWIKAYQQLFKTQMPLKKHMRNERGNRLYKEGDGGISQ